MRDENDNLKEDDLEAPPGLVSAIKELPQERLFVSRAVDEAVLRAARRRLLKPEAPRPAWLNFVPWMAAATGAAVILIAVGQSFMPQRDLPAGVVAFRDLNHDGQVDILDAFTLARRLQAGRVDDRHLDLNGDGRVDAADVASLAARAVKLDKGGSL